MYHVLLPVDTNQKQAETIAETLAEMPFEHGSITVTILNVFEQFEGEGGDVKVSSEEIYEDTTLPESVSVAEASLAERDIDAGVEQRHGEPAEKIVDFAREEDVDMILMGGRKRSPVGKALFGSVSQKVLLSSERPVTVIVSE